MTAGALTRRTIALAIAATAVLALSAGAAFATQPDGMLRKKGSAGPFTGKNIINDTAAGQIVNRSVAVGGKAKYEIKVKNSSIGTCLTTEIEELNYSGTGSYNRKYKSASGANITDDVMNGTYEPELAQNESKTITMIVKPMSGDPGDQGTGDIRARCGPDRDLIRAITTIT